MDSGTESKVFVSLEEWGLAFSSLWKPPGSSQAGIASSGVGVAGNEAISVLMGQGLEPRCSWFSLQCSAQKENHFFFCKWEVARAETLLPGRRASAGTCDRDSKRILHALKTCPPPFLP